MNEQAAFSVLSNRSVLPREVAYGREPYIKPA